MKRILVFAMLMAGAIAFTNCTQQSVANEGNLQEVSDPTYHFVEGHAPVWDEAIAQVMELADAMPEDYYDFKPHDSVRTFAGQLIHIGASSKVIANMFLKDIRPEGPPPDMDVSAMTKAEIVAFVKTNLEETGEIMKSMSDEQLAEKIKSFSGNEMTRLEGLLFVHDHLTNHKGKANLYVRISGNEPPSYRYY